jgi:hypothetical protein
MTSQTGNARGGWRRAIVGGVLAVGLMTGFGASTAFAQPAEPPGPSTSDGPCTGDDCTRDEEAAVAAAAGCEPDDKKCSDSANAPKKINADQILMAVNEQYSNGDGGGQISQLIDDAMKLRMQGFRPSNANAQALQDALDDRPNQTPLIEALKATLQYQRKLQAQQQMAAQQQQQSGGNVPVIPGG